MKVGGAPKWAGWSGRVLVKNSVVPFIVGSLEAGKLCGPSQPFDKQRGWDCIRWTRQDSHHGRNYYRWQNI